MISPYFTRMLFKILCNMHVPPRFGSAPGLNRRSRRTFCLGMHASLPVAGARAMGTKRWNKLAFAARTMCIHIFCVSCMLFRIITVRNICLSTPMSPFACVYACASMYVVKGLMMHPWHSHNMFDVFSMKSQRPMNHCIRYRRAQWLSALHIASSLLMDVSLETTLVTQTALMESCRRRWHGACSHVFVVPCRNVAVTLCFC